MSAKYCTLCDRMVAPNKRFSWAIFLLLCITGIGGIFYLLWYFFFTGKSCSICGNKNLKSRKPKQATNI